MKARSSREGCCTDEPATPDSLQGTSRPSRAGHGRALRSCSRDGDLRADLGLPAEQGSRRSLEAGVHRSRAGAEPAGDASGVLTGMTALDRQAFENARDFSLDAFQVAALDALDEGRNVLVAAPTGS